MSFTKEQNFSKNRPLTDKLMVFDWAWTNSPTDIEDVVKLGFKNISITCFIAVKGLTLDQSKLYADKVADYIKKANDHGLQVFTCFHSDNAGNNNPQTNCFFSQAEINQLKQVIDYFMNLTKNMNIIYAGWNEPNGVFWSATGGQLSGNDSPSQIASVDGWIDMEQYIIDTSKKYNSNAMNVALNFEGVPNWGGTDNSTIQPGTPIALTLGHAKQKGLFDKVDGLAFHPYQEPDKVTYPEQELFWQGTGTNFPLVTNEFGYSRYGIPGEHWQGDLSMSDAIKFTQRQALIFDYVGYAIEGIYSLVGNSYYMKEEYSNRLTGLAYAMGSFISEMKGYQLDHWVNTPTPDNLTTMEYVAVYKKDGAPTKVLYWKCYDDNSSSQYTIDGQDLFLRFNSSVQIKTLDNNRILKEMANYKYSYLGFTPNPTADNIWAAKTMLCGSQDGITWHTLAWIPKLDNLRDMQVTQYKDWYYIVGTLQIWRTKDFINFDWIDTSIFNSSSLEFIWAPEIFKDKGNKYHIVLTAANKGDDIGNGIRDVFIFDIDLDSGIVSNPWQKVDINCGNDIDASIHWYNNKYYMFMSHDHVYTADNYLGNYKLLKTNLPESPNTSSTVGYVEGIEFLDTSNNKYLYDDRVNNNQIQSYVRRTILNEDLTDYSDYTLLLCDGGKTLMRHGDFWVNN